MNNTKQLIFPVIMVLVFVFVLLFDNAKICDATNEYSLGNVLNATEIATSFNDSRRTSIETDKGIYFIKGVTSITKGNEIFMVEMDNCKDRIKIDDVLFKVYLNK